MLQSSAIPMAPSYYGITLSEEQVISDLRVLSHILRNKDKTLVADLADMSAAKPKHSGISLDTRITVFLREL